MERDSQNQMKEHSQERLLHKVKSAQARLPKLRFADQRSLVARLNFRAGVSRLLFHGFFDARVWQEPHHGD